MNKQELEKQIEAVQAKIEDKQTEIDGFEISEYVDENQYDTMLDEVYGDVEIAGLSYSTSRALEQLDPIAYRTGYNDWLDSLDLEDVQEYRELQDELEELKGELLLAEEESEELEEEED